MGSVHYLLEFEQNPMHKKQKERKGKVIPKKNKKEKTPNCKPMKLINCLLIEPTNKIDN